MKNFLSRVLLTLHHTWYVWRVLSHPKNRSKGTWRNLTAYELVKLARRELEEVEAAVWMHNTERYGKYGSHRVSLECGDLGAFAAMISDVCKKNVKA